MKQRLDTDVHVFVKLRGAFSLAVWIKNYSPSYSAWDCQKKLLPISVDVSSELKVLPQTGNRSSTGIKMLE